MSAATAQMPGYWQFVWMFWMQPVTLHHRLRACGIDDPDMSGWRWWRRRGELAAQHCAYAWRLLFTTVVTLPLALVPVLLIAGLLDMPVDLVSVAGGVAISVAVSVAGSVMFLRLPTYPLEALWQGLLFLARGRHPARTLRWAPVLFHDLSYLPHPLLARHIVAAADDDPALAARVLDACRIAPGQRAAGRRALAELQARELTGLAQTGGYADLAQLRGRWLPGSDTDNPLLRALGETARFLLAAQGAMSPHIALQHLDAAGQRLDAVDNLRRSSDEPLARFVPEALSAFREATARLRGEALRAAENRIPNPFITGDPLTQDMGFGRAVFRGREAQVQQIESLLAGSQASASIALIGPRRCGKSSLINMLRVMLPDTQVILFDLQDNPATTPAAFYRALVRQTREQARRDRHLALPEFPDGPPIEALRDWLDAVEGVTGVARLLICIDEFERLESLFPAGGQDLLQFMGLLRATIQHRRRVRLLVAGAAPFEELDRLWNDHFVNLREIAIGYLDAPAAIGLLTRPIDAFPPQAIPREVAEAIVARTGGQPYLTQLYGWLLVERLNLAERRAATPDDVPAVEEDALEQAGYYFRNLWQNLPDAAQPALHAFARGEAAEFTPATCRWLRKHLILDADGRWCVPVFARWIAEHGSL